jgi:hypothetical protein
VRYRAALKATRFPTGFDILFTQTVELEQPLGQPSSSVDIFSEHHSLPRLPEKRNWRTPAIEIEGPIKLAIAKNPRQHLAMAMIRL